MKARFAVRASIGALIASVAILTAPAAFAQETVGDIVVTAQKREESINDVGMSIQAATGEQLMQLGITDTSQLDRIVPGFSATQTYYGTPVYTIRGVGFFDTSLAGSPTVSVYVDEVPIPYSIMSTIASIDPERVEVLKGPQGTLFGGNATGGAINYIAAKPTDEFTAGVDFSFSRFETTDLSGFVSGPITDTLRYRVAARFLNSDPWQYMYSHGADSTLPPSQRPGYAEWGAKDLVQARAQLEWDITPNLTANLSLAGFVDQSQNQMPHLFGIAPLSPTSVVDPRLGVAPFNQFAFNGIGSHYPFAPRDARAANWSNCVNDSPFNPPIGLELYEPGTRPLSATDCEPAARDNDLFVAALRVNWEMANGMTLTSLTSSQQFNRNEYIEGDGTVLQDYENHQIGSIEVFYQELRLAGTFWGDRGSWVVGANYERDETEDRFLQTYGGSTANPTAIPGTFLCTPDTGGASDPGFDCSGIPADVFADLPFFYLFPLGPTAPTNNQTTEVAAIFASGDYPIFEDLTLQLGIRYTDTSKEYVGCGFDGGDGSWSAISQSIQNLLQVLTGGITIDTYLQPGAPGGNGINVGAGNCGTTGPGPNFHPIATGFTDTLDEDNLSWRAGLNWTPTEDLLIYGNVSRGFKIGAYPTVASSSGDQLDPAVQEELLAYEIGFKASLLNNRLQLNGALFYYDYTDKQLLGAIQDPIFGPLPALVNIPNSHVQGFELNAVWIPIDGLRIAPVVSFSESRIDSCEDEPVVAVGAAGCNPNGHFFNFGAFTESPAVPIDLHGQQFPVSPEWQASLDVQYDWQINDRLGAFVGFNVNYHAATPGFFQNPAPYPSAVNSYPQDVLEIDAYTLLDIRAGFELEDWRVQFWGRNVTDEYYWHSAAHVNDVLYRYTGMPATYGVTVSWRH